MNLLYKTFKITWDCCKITITINQTVLEERVCKTRNLLQIHCSYTITWKWTKRGMNILVLKDIFSHIIAESCKQMLAIF